MPSRKKKTKSGQEKSKAATPKRAKKVTATKHAISAKVAAKKKPSKKKTSSKSSPSRNRQTLGRRAQVLDSSRRREGTSSSRQTGDLEGLSRSEHADSESVAELVEEGNVFEAGAVAGVEKADDQDTKEIHTQEVPEDDVPDEYLDKD